ncbi:MAG: hypothetical protein V7681_04525 [Halopseudomonas sabulinigri]
MSRGKGGQQQGAVSMGLDPFPLIYRRVAVFIGGPSELPSVD